MKKRDFLLRGFNAFTLAERICGSAGAKLQADETAKSAETSLNPSPLTGETSPHFPSPLAKFRTADKPVSESRNHGSGSEVMTGAGANECQDAGEGAGVRGNKAFTLAEVLITLVIIGVIGALTVPALIQNTQKQEYVSALKKAYSTLSQVTQQIIAEEGSPKSSCDTCNDGWAYNTDNIFELYKKHINTSEECPSGKAGCFLLESLWYPRGSQQTWVNFNESKHNVLAAADGIQIVFASADPKCSRNEESWAEKTGLENSCGEIFVDINGVKKPNTYGRDVFMFTIKENGLSPFGCSIDDCADGTGWACACKVLREGAMNY